MPVHELYVAIVLVVTFVVIGIWFVRSPARGKEDGENKGSACAMHPELMLLQQRFQRGEITRDEFEEAARRFSCSS